MARVADSLITRTRPGRTATDVEEGKAHSKNKANAFPACLHTKREPCGCSLSAESLGMLSWKSKARNLGMQRQHRSSGALRQAEKYRAFGKAQQSEANVGTHITAQELGVKARLSSAMPTASQHRADSTSWVHLKTAGAYVVRLLGSGHDRHLRMRLNVSLSM